MSVVLRYVGLMKNAEKSLLVRFGRRIRKLRSLQRISQEELAELAGVHRTYIGMIERGEKNPTLRSLLKLSRGLRVPLPKILEDV
jgi:transcriptional regulator with XRE-family HTH domain